MNHFHEHHNNEPRTQHARGPRTGHPAFAHGRREEFGGMPIDFGPPFGRGRGRGGRRRMRRGDVRAAILVLLDEQPANGYRLMQEIEERSEGAWRPSPGSVYPALSQLEDEALVSSEKTDGGNTFSLTRAGVKYVDENRERLGQPWANLGGDFKGAQLDYRKQLKPLFEAIKQVAQVGDEATVERANEILAKTRRDLYALLAEEPQTTPDPKHN